jgi:hypothetical protein
MPRAARPAPVVHLTTAETADRLRIEESTLADWRRDDKGPAYIRGESNGTKATILYPLAEIEAWERRRLVVPAGT